MTPEVTQALPLKCTSDGLGIFDANGMKFASVGRYQEANAAFIVQACNSHEELLAAAKGARQWLLEHSAWAPNENHEYEHIRRLEAAIAHAEGEV